MWTRFMDMHSGGGRKENHDYIFIEADKYEAMVIFQNRFGHNPNRVSCTCCGEDYWVSSDSSLEQLTAYDRGCAFNQMTGKYEERPDTRYGMKYLTLDEYLKDGNVLVIRADDIKPEERVGELREQGYVWVD
jgi:hypothetical protein